MRMTGQSSQRAQQTTLFGFSSSKEKLYCMFCKAKFTVEKSEDNLVLLSCGHVTIRDGIDLEVADKVLRERKHGRTM